MSPSPPIDAIRLRGRPRKRPPAARHSCILFGVAALIFTALLLVLPWPAAAQTMRGEASLITTGGYSRITVAPKPPAADSSPTPQPASPQKPAPSTAVNEAPLRDPNRPVTAELYGRGENLRVLFPFATPTPAAIFQRADTVWLVFDTAAKLDVAALQNEPSRTIRDATLSKTNAAQVLRLRFERPRLVSAVMEGTGWSVVIGESVMQSTKPLAVIRNIMGPPRTSITVPFDDPRQLHRIDDADVGDTLLVITGLGPSRGFVKTREFVELLTLASTHGVVIQPLADDLSVELSADKIVLGRPSGLTLSEAGQADRPDVVAVPERGPHHEER